MDSSLVLSSRLKLKYAYRSIFKLTYTTYTHHAFEEIGIGIKITLTRLVAATFSTL